MVDTGRSASVRCEIQRLLKTKKYFESKIEDCERSALPLLQVGLAGIMAKLSELGQQAETLER